MRKAPDSHAGNFLFNLYLERSLYEPYITVYNRISKRQVNPDLLKSVTNTKNRRLIKDIPSYLETSRSNKVQGYAVKQYQGYLVNLKSFGSTQEYLSSQLSKRNIKNLYSKKRRLEREKDITYQCYYGDINQHIYTQLFQKFFELLKTRFTQKQIFNRDLLYWDKLYESTFERILKKKASLFVIYDAENPICICLNYHLEQTLFSHIQTYDMGFSNYNLGDISIFTQLDWCFKHNFEIYDFSKGTNPYKLKWCNTPYHFHYHIFFNKGSIVSFIWANIMRIKLDIIQFLRDLGVLGNLVRFDHWKFLLNRKKLQRMEWSMEAAPKNFDKNG